MKKLKISQLAPGFRYLQTLALKVLHGLAPSYISDLIRVKPVSSRYSLRSADGILRFEPKFKTLTTLR